MSEKIKIGISSCLLGNNVRYDGGNKSDLPLKAALDHLVEWVPVCPEVEAGLSVPREPMQLSSDGERLRIMTIETKMDRTNQLTGMMQGKLKQLEREGVCGFVFKARSPSCGVHDTPVYSSTGGLIGLRAGLFADAAIRRFPSLPVEDEERLRDPAIRDAFIARARACR